ncbi:hypothetical protein [Chitinophaga nivalis]|uniref:Cupin 2 conserved barrel domain-containing protein n=1 Tax=Chitinophaga nivalis TaxID=2991709 RepID=A0ABT3IHU8_9BACT|nr:hypothetical protein [Chitinophaga nivalis]MCW3466808.1 hypothetical protein [Chitinophaga nivalis]MCW3483501.1 hypothetical protein [Chitinophaga nivalis]
MITVTPIQLVGEDDRGSNYMWECTRSGDFMLCYRHAGSSSGQHYHEGKSPNKDPEIMFLFSGKAAIHWCPLDGKEIITTEVTAPARVEVPVNVWHQLIAITDCCFIELNSTADVQRDSVRVWREDFEKMINVNS